MGSMDSPIPLSDIEKALAWVDTHKLSKSTKKINRDFSDAVLLAEILAKHYPKLVEMHNYPPRNSHALKLNNWMTLTRKVLKKLKVTLSYSTMEQLAYAAPGVIERVLVMVYEKVCRDEEMANSLKEMDQNTSSGGSYYEACPGDDQVLIVPLKTRVNGALETVQQKVVSFEVFCGIKNELKDAKDALEMLKQKVDHLDEMVKLKDERIDELQKQLERKASRRKDIDVIQTNLIFPSELGPDCKYDTLLNSSTAEKLMENEVKESISNSTLIADDIKLLQPKSAKQDPIRSHIPVAKEHREDVKSYKSGTTIESPHDVPCINLDNISGQDHQPTYQPFNLINNAFSITNDVYCIQAENVKRVSQHSIKISRIPLKHDDIRKVSRESVREEDKIHKLEPRNIFPDIPLGYITQVQEDLKVSNCIDKTCLKELAKEREKREELNRVKSDVFTEALDQKTSEPLTDVEDYKDSEQDVITINGTICDEVEEIRNSLSRSKMLPTALVDSWGVSNTDPQ